LLLLGIDNQRALVSGLKRAAALEKQADGTAVFAGFDFHRYGHCCSLFNGIHGN
jgi:hypothetical protein